MNSEYRKDELLELGIIITLGAQDADKDIWIVVTPNGAFTFSCWSFESIEKSRQSVVDTILSRFKKTMGWERMKPQCEQTRSE